MLNYLLLWYITSLTFVAFLLLEMQTAVEVSALGPVELPSIGTCTSLNPETKMRGGASSLALPAYNI